MRRGWLLLALTALAAGGCGQKGPLYLPDKGGKIVTSAPSAPQRAPAAPEPAPPAAAPPAATPPAEAAPAPPKPSDKDKDQDQNAQPPK